MVKKWVSFILVFCLIVVPSSYARDDIQYWSWATLDLYENKHLKISNHSELRFSDDASNFNLWFISPRIKLKAHKNFHLGVNYTYLENEVKSSNQSEFKFQHRFELEAIPRFSLGELWKIENRNRLEWRWIEDRGSDNARFRHRWQVLRKIEKFEWWDHLYTSNEIFVDFSKRKVNENRWVPLGSQFALNQHLKVGIFYMLRSQDRAKWKTDHVFGSHFKVVF